MMRSVALAVCLLFTVGETAARADPTPEKLERPTTSRRKALYGLSLGSLALVIAGTATLGVSLANYQSVRDGCGATNSCSSDQLAGGKLEEVVGWALIGGGVVLGLVTMIVAIVDSRAARRPVALIPTLSGMALAGSF
jgi:hypothetical protein